MLLFYTIFFFIGFFIFISTGFYLPVGYSLGLFITISVLVYLIPNKSNFVSKKKLLLLLLLVLGISLGRLYFMRNVPSRHDIHYYNDYYIDVIIEGYIAEAADVRLDHIKYMVWVETINFLGQERVVKGYVLVTGERYPVYEYGQNLRVRGRLKTASSDEKFSYKNYLERYDIYSLMPEAVLEPLDGNKGYLVFKYLFTLKEKFELALNQVYAEPHGSFMAGLLLGARRGISPALMEEFNVTGLTHIIAISGSNITIIVAIILSLFSFLPRKIANRLAVIFVILFVVTVGCSAAVVRAAIMGIIGIVALQHGRNTNITISLLATAFFMVLWNPKILFWDVGFQLSFLAVMGLMYIAPYIEKYVMWIPNTFALRDSLVLTLAAQIAAGPIIVYNFERFSMVAPLANVLVGPTTTWAMLFGFLAVIGKYIFFPLGLLMGYLGYLILEYILLVVNYCAVVPYAAVEVVKFPEWGIFGYYLVLVGILVKLRIKN